MALPSINILKDEIQKPQSSLKNIAVTKLLKKRGVMLDTLCKLCWNQDESVNHILSHTLLQDKFGHLQTSLLFKMVLIHCLFPTFITSHRKMKKISDGNQKTCIHRSLGSYKKTRMIFFEGRCYLANEKCIKQQRKHIFAFKAQLLDKEQENEKKGPENCGIKKWNPPPPNQFKCNVAAGWDKVSLSSGSAWVLRDHEGAVLMHSRRAFSHISSLHEAHYESFRRLLET